MEIKLKNVLFSFRKELLTIIMKTFIFFCCISAFSFTPSDVLSQNSKVKIDANKALTVNEVFDLIMEQTDYKFLYQKGIFKNHPKVKVKKGIISTNKLLRKSLSNSNFNVELSSNNTVIVRERKSEIIKPQSIQIQVSGTVVDSNNQPLPGANVLEKGTTSGAISDFNGKFIISVTNENAVLIVSYVGYKALEVPVNGQATLTIILAEDAAALDAIVLTGLRASQEKALAVKRQSVNFVDAITAEDAGKLPDGNVAEALQRIPGIAIQRTRGQGDFISIRGLGPEFVRGTINGRTLVSASESFNSTLSGGLGSGTGRATNFDVLPSEIISSIEVFKTNSAEQVEGGLGGVVNIKTSRPLSTGNKYGITAKGVNYQSRDISPSVSAFGSWKNDKNNFGALFSVSYSERKIREDAVKSFAYAQPSRWNIAETYADDYFTFSVMPETFEEDRKRLTFNGTLQWKPSENTDITLDLSQSSRDLSHKAKQANFRVFPFGGTNVNDLVTDNTSTVESFSGSSPLFLNSDIQTGNDDLLSGGLNLTHQAGKWKLIFDASLSRTETNFSFERAALKITETNGSSLTALRLGTEIRDDGLLFLESQNSFDFSDPNNFDTRGFSIDNKDITDQEYAFKADAVKAIENSSLFSAFKAGVRYRVRNRENLQESFLDNLPTTSDGSLLSLNVGASGVGTVNGLSGFLDNRWNSELYESLTFIDDIREWRAINEAAGGNFEIIKDPNNSFKVDENTFAFYSQFDIDGELFGLPVTGNVGLRFVNTSVEVNGAQQGIELIPINPADPNSVSVTRFVGDPTPYKETGSYFKALPSMNLRFEAAESVYFRVAYSKSITRPQFQDLGGIAFNTSQNTILKAGNAELLPYESDNFDVGLEWYTSRSGIIGISFFRKNLSSFVTNVTLTDVDFVGNNWSFFTTRENQGEGSITGTEISFQQPLKFLPAPFDGLGIIANFTFADGKQFLNDGSPISFPGVSDFSFNSALYFDNGGKFQARFAYTFRDDFLLLANDVFGQEQYVNEYGQLDASVSYKIAKGITLFGEATNLTNEVNKLYSSNTTSPSFGLERPTSYEITGPRFGFGVRAVF